LIAVSVVSIGIMAFGVIAVSLDNPIISVENAESGADTVLSLMMRWYC
jgi:hypothetical protein